MELDEMNLKNLAQLLLLKIIGTQIALEEKPKLNAEITADVHLTQNVKTDR